MLPKELHQVEYEVISVPQGSVRLVKRNKKEKVQLVQKIHLPPLPKIHRAIYYKIAFQYFTGCDLYENFFFGS
ncbi:hypothetical protein TNCV_1982321 [Trichonephila clavipes]|nr:hypothetical protein TNCV_1982321 [Trichonephila clavipes]